MRFTMLVPTLILAGGLLGGACADPQPTSESPTTPIQLTGGICQYTPSIVSLAVDSMAHFWADSNCNLTVKRKMTLTWSNPQTPVRLGFGIAAPCSTQLVFAPASIKVVRCDVGPGSLKIYSDSVGTSLLQTIAIEDDLP